VALRSMLFSGQVPPFHASSKFQPKVKLSTSQLLRTRPCSICCSAASSQLPGVVALDVEYVHLHQAASVQSGAEKAELAQAAWVAVVDDLGQVLVDQRIALEQPVMDRHQSAVSQSQQPVMVWAGGVPLKELRRLGRPRSEVASAVREAVKGKLLVGHGLNKVGCDLFDAVCSMVLTMSWGCAALPWINLLMCCQLTVASGVQTMPCHALQECLRLVPPAGPEEPGPGYLSGS
jgi:hypothetical protein